MSLWTVAGLAMLGLRPALRNRGQERNCPESDSRGDVAATHRYFSADMAYDQPALRAFAIRTELSNLPRDSIGNHLWPSDPDATPRWVELLDELSGLTGSPCPARTYRTRRQFEASVASIDAGLRRIALPAPSVERDLAAEMGDLCNELEAGELPDRNPPLPGHEAAKGFLAWLRANGHAGEITADRLGDLYAEHCAEIGHVETHVREWRKHFKHLGGISRRQVNEPGVYGRHRPTVWTIAPETHKEASVHTLSGNRRAA